MGAGVGRRVVTGGRYVLGGGARVVGGLQVQFILVQGQT